MAEKVALPEKPAREMGSITLKNGVVVTYPLVVTTRDYMAAQKACKEPHLLTVYMIQRLCQFDGKQLTVGDILDLDLKTFTQVVKTFDKDEADGTDEGNG